MKKSLLLLCMLPAISFGQYNVAYTVTITELMARADDCDGGAPFCINAPQDPVFNIWTLDGESNEHTSCWIYEDDNEAAYGAWKDIQDLEIANETGVNTGYITFEMSGFESDNLSPGCSSALGDDAINDRQQVEQFDLSTIPQQTVFTDEINLNDTYYAKIEIYWEDLNAGLFNLENTAQFTMAPNPSEGVVTITLSENTVHSFDVEVLDLSGRIVRSAAAQSNAIAVDLSNELSGVYFVRVLADGKTGTRKLTLK